MKRWRLLIVVGLVMAPTITSTASVTDVRPFELGSWQQLRKAHAGQPLVVHFWGMTCGPCRTEMPQWGLFLKQHAGLHLVTIDTDLFPNQPGTVKAMLDRSGLSAAENWMFRDDFVERLRYEIDPQWQGEIPLTLLIASNGTETTIEGVADFAKVDSWLKAQIPGPN